MPQPNLDTIRRKLTPELNKLQNNRRSLEWVMLCTATGALVSFIALLVLAIYLSSGKAVVGLLATCCVTSAILSITVASSIHACRSQLSLFQFALIIGDLDLLKEANKSLTCLWKLGGQLADVYKSISKSGPKQ